MIRLKEMKEPLIAEKIFAAIEPENKHFCANLEIFPTLDSTSTYLLSQAKLGVASGSVCFAEEQTRGRGRLGREWYSPAGTNIYCSLLWRFKEIENLSGLSIAVAVMVVTVLRKYGIVAGVQLKWPNDILFSGRKLGGILLERGGDAVVIGIGLNLFLPETSDPNWIGIEEILGREALRNYLAGLLVNELLAQLPVYAARGVKLFIDDWRRYDVLRGKTISVHAGNQIFTGVMQGIDERGELLLNNDEGKLEKFCYGEVSIRF